MEAILNYFGSSHLAVQVKKGAASASLRSCKERGLNTNLPLPFYFIEIANAKGVETVLQHLLSHPLQGYKYHQLAIVIKRSERLSHLQHHF